MTWKYERSKERIDKERNRIEKTDISIKKLTREMDLSNLSPTDARIVHGVHMYSDITNYSELLGDSLLSKDNFRRLYRYLNAIMVEQRHIIQATFDGDKIQVQ